VTCLLFPHAFKYDPLGRRIEKSSTATTSVFAYDDYDLIEETNASGGVVARYTQGQNIDEPLSEMRSGTTSYYEADWLSSVTSLSNSTGSVVQTYTFDSYGKNTGSSGSLTNSLQYAGRDFDSETSLYYDRARYYDPSTGRFISEDPIRFRGGIEFYTYAYNSPINGTDPSGLCSPGSPGCPAPNPNNPQPLSQCSRYTDFTHRFFCQALAGDDPVGKCVRGCLLDQLDPQQPNGHPYKCDEANLHCGCFNACGFTTATGFKARAARLHFNCDQPMPPIENWLPLM
jgi:RHS repeat-associated protein